MTNLQEIRDNALSISISALVADTLLVQDIQEHLAKIGFIDLSSVTLGVLSTNTEAAIQKFQNIAGVNSTNITASFAKKLIDITTPKITPPPPAAITITLTGSVGAGGVNNPADVLAIKNRLADLGFQVSRNSIIDTDTIQAIKLFQAIINEKDTLDVGGNVDGRIDVNGKTRKALEKSTAPRWQEMASGSILEGFLNNDDLQGDNGDFGTNWIVETVQAAALIYKDQYLKTHPDAALIATNDISKISGGKFPPHASHQVGMCCDIRLPRKDGTSGGITYQDSEYDRAAMRAMLEAFRKQSKHKIRRIFFNDMTLIAAGLCQAVSGHNDHAHVDILAP
ncbi:Peptidoglycan-binding protein [Nostoc sp. DSM 114161]|jgi:peptidoglycan hydrolase-like protein with peptidoglycan-binding domain|uniref:peptidoglycan-binding domain-containing protein n=1 Tax=Nostoc sp. DSM 114161 TaxID=3440143 RepID=UPI004046452D